MSEAQRTYGWHGSISAGKGKSSRTVSGFATTQGELYAKLAAGLEVLKRTASRCRPDTWRVSIHEGHQDRYPDGVTFNVFRLHLGTAPDKERFTGGREAVEAFIAAGPFNTGEPAKEEA